MSVILFDLPERGLLVLINKNIFSCKYDFFKSKVQKRDTFHHFINLNYHQILANPVK